MFQFLFDLFIVVFCVTWFIFMGWFLVWLWAYLIGSYFEHRIEVHWRMMDRFAETTNYPMYQKHKEQLDKNVKRLNAVNRVIDFF